MSTRKKKPSGDPRKIAAGNASLESDANLVMARLDTGVWAPSPPPGIHIERFSVEDRREAKRLGRPEATKTKILEVWTSERDRVIDAWLDGERWLRTAATILLSPTEDMREQIWNLVYRQSGDYLIQVTKELLTAKGFEPPVEFSAALGALCRLRNLFAHQTSRPPQSVPSTGLVFLQAKEFKKGGYVTVTFDEMYKTLADAKPVFAWLMETIPEADGVKVQFEDDLFDSLMDV